MDRRRRYTSGLKAKKSLVHAIFYGWHEISRTKCHVICFICMFVCSKVVEKILCVVKQVCNASCNPPTNSWYVTVYGWRYDWLLSSWPLKIKPKRELTCQILPNNTNLKRKTGWVYNIRPAPSFFWLIIIGNRWQQTILFNVRTPQVNFLEN